MISESNRRWSLHVKIQHEHRAPGSLESFWVLLATASGGSSVKFQICMTV